MIFRQTQSILHSWFGITVIWLAFFIFFTGSIAYFRTEINMWSQPNSIENIQKIPPSKNSAQMAFNYLNVYAKHADRWQITIADERMPLNTIQWQDSNGKYQKLQNPVTGEILTNNSKMSVGDFFFKLHSTLYPIPRLIGSLIISIVAIMILLTLITGVIVHKKIIQDFFTFRAYKGQRTLLDLHHITGVVTLPFYFAMAFTGLLILFYLVLPWGLYDQYGKNGIKNFYNDMQFVHMAKIEPSETKSMQPFDSFLKKIPDQTSTGATLNKVEVKNPNTSKAQITFEYDYKGIISLNHQQYIFSANTGKQLEQPRNLGMIAQFASSTYGIHLSYYASTWMRLILSGLGMVGCVMLISGAILWQKKRVKNRDSFQYKLVTKLNIFMFLGLPFASSVYFFTCRIIPAYSIYAFFLIWFSTLFLSFISSYRKSTLIMLICTMLTLFLIPISSLLIISPSVIWNNILSNESLYIVGVDVTSVCLGFVYLLLIKIFISGRIGEHK